MSAGIGTELDRLVLAGRISGHTFEEDASYVHAVRPTLTYRMYTDDPIARHNLGEFVASVAAIGGVARVTRLEGTVAQEGRLRRTRQVCVAAGFDRFDDLEQVMLLVRSRFTASGADSAPGSWRYPDVRVTGTELPPAGSIQAFAHCWPARHATAVVVTLEPSAPLPGAQSRPVHVLESWSGLLGGRVPSEPGCGNVLARLS